MIPKIRIGNVTTEGCKAGVLVEINGEPCDSVQSAKVSLDRQGFTCATIEFTGDVGFIGDTKEYDKKSEEFTGKPLTPEAELKSAREKLIEAAETLKNYCESRGNCNSCLLSIPVCNRTVPKFWLLENLK